MVVYEIHGKCFNAHAQCDVQHTQAELYSALFSRRLNFEVFADLILPAKITPSKLT